MQIVDAHHHLWQLSGGPLYYPWLQDAEPLPGVRAARMRDLRLVLLVRLHGALLSWRGGNVRSAEPVRAAEQTVRGCRFLIGSIQV